MFSMCRFEQIWGDKKINIITIVFGIVSLGCANFSSPLYMSRFWFHILVICKFEFDLHEREQTQDKIIIHAAQNAIHVPHNLM